MFKKTQKKGIKKHDAHETQVSNVANMKFLHAEPQVAHLGSNMTEILELSNDPKQLLTKKMM